MYTCVYTYIYIYIHMYIIGDRQGDPETRRADGGEARRGGRQGGTTADNDSNSNNNDNNNNNNDDDDNDNHNSNRRKTNANDYIQIMIMIIILRGRATGRDDRRGAPAASAELSRALPPALFFLGARGGTSAGRIRI